MKIYNKLVRDKIPEIIENNGEVANTRILSNEDWCNNYRSAGTRTCRHRRSFKSNFKR